VQGDEAGGNLQRAADEDLLESFLEGRREEFAELVRRYEHRITNFINRMVGNYQRAEELCQEVFLRVFRSASSFDRKHRFSTWLYTIARNLASNELRDQARSGRRFTIRTEDWPEEGKARDLRSSGAADPLVIAATAELREKLAEAMGSLQENYRAALVLKEYQDMTYSEISEVLDATPGTIKSWVYRAKRELAAKLKNLKAF